MATKSGRSTTGTRKQPGRATKSMKPPAKRSKAGAKRGSAKKAPSKEGGRRAKAAREPRFYLIFKAVAPQDIYVVPVYDDYRVTDAQQRCLEREVRNIRVMTVEFAHLVKKADDEPFKTCGPSRP